MPDAKTPEALTIAATRAADRNRWAILIASQTYDDKAITPLTYPLADAKLLQDVLTQRYQVPSDQILFLGDESLVRIRESIQDFLRKITTDGRVLVFFSGHAYKDRQNQVYLAPKSFDFKQPAATGLPLQWLVDQFESCQSRDKLFTLGRLPCRGGGRSEGGTLVGGNDSDAQEVGR